MQGVIVLSVVIVYELVRRWEIRLQQRTVATELATGHDLARESSRGAVHEHRDRRRPPCARPPTAGDGCAGRATC